MLSYDNKQFLNDKNKYIIYPNLQEHINMINEIKSNNCTTTNIKDWCDILSINDNIYIITNYKGQINTERDIRYIRNEILRNLRQIKDSIEYDTWIERQLSIEKKQYLLKDINNKIIVDGINHGISKIPALLSFYRF